MRNARIRLAMVECNLRQWQVARIMGIHEGTLSRMMRDELPADEQDRIIELIRNHAKGGQDNE